MFATRAALAEDDRVETVRLGRTGLQVSVAGLGCGGHSRLGMRVGRDEAHAVGIVRRALDLGVTFFDTARSYGTEPAVGKAIRGRRDEVAVSTKAPIRRGDGLISAAQLAESLDLSLSLLGTDHVDVLHLHGMRLEHYSHCLDELLPEMRRQRDAGKVRFLGVTEVFHRDPAHLMFQQVLPDDHFDVAMVGFNLLNPSARASVLPQTGQADVGTLNMFAVRWALSHPDALAELLAGLVEAGEVDAADVDLADPLGFVRDFAGVSSVVEAAYRFCRHEPGIDVILTGTSDAAHLEDNIRAILAPPLPDGLTDRLNRMFGAVNTVSGN